MRKKMTRKGKNCSESWLELLSCLLLLLGNSSPLYQTAFPPHRNKDSRMVFIHPSLQEKALPEHF